MRPDRAARSMLLTTADAALAAGVEPATIRKWHERGFLTRQGTRRCALWDMDELAAVVSAERRPRRRVARNLQQMLDTTVTLRASQPGV